jgi:hypothetical protein
MTDPDLYEYMRIKRNKLFLLPALTGVGLLIIFIYYFSVINPARNRIISFIIFPKKIPAFLLPHLPKPYYEMRNYQEIHFTGKPDKDDIKLNFARVRISEIIQQNDTINGVHFSFGDSTKVDIFIHALDVLNQERAQIYIIDKGEIWFYEESPYL